MSCVYYSPLYYNSMSTYESYQNYTQKHGITVEMPASSIDTEAPANDAPKANHPADGLHGRGLFHYRKWWERSEVDIFVNGHELTGIPIFDDENTLRVVNSDYSYFIPMEKIDFIRTTDGLGVKD